MHSSEHRLTTPARDPNQLLLSFRAMFLAILSGYPCLRSFLSILSNYLLWRSLSGLIGPIGLAGQAGSTGMAGLSGWLAG